MKLGHVLPYVILAFVALPQGNSALLAQDVAAAARANRANNASRGAQEPVGDLKTCLMENTSGRDRKDLAKWVFFAMAAHPEMRTYMDANMAAAAAKSSQTTAALFTRLLTDSCVTQVRAVMKASEGAQSLRLAFETLGQLAMQELMVDKSVQDAMGSFERLIDQTRLKEALADK